MLKLQRTPPRRDGCELETQLCGRGNTALFINFCIKCGVIFPFYKQGKNRRRLEARVVASGALYQVMVARIGQLGNLGRESVMEFAGEPDSGVIDLGSGGSDVGPFGAYRDGDFVKTPHIESSES